MGQQDALNAECDTHYAFEVCFNRLPESAECCHGHWSAHELACIVHEDTVIGQWWIKVWSRLCVLLDRSQILLDLGKCFLHLSLVGDIACICMHFDVETLAGSLGVRLVL